MGRREEEEEEEGVLGCFLMREDGAVFMEVTLHIMV